MIVERFRSGVRAFYEHHEITWENLRSKKYGSCLLDQSDARILGKYKVYGGLANLAMS